MKYDGVGPDWVDKVNIAALISIMLYSCCCSMMKGQTQTLIDSSNFMRFLYDSSDWHQSTLKERVLKWCWIVFIWQNVLIFLWWIRGHGSYLVRKNKELKCCCSDLMQHHVFPVAYLVTRLLWADAHWIAKMMFSVSDSFVTHKISLNPLSYLNPSRPWAKLVFVI